MTRLALTEVLEEHDWITPRGYAWPCCVCGVEFPDGEDAAYAHVAAAVTAWLAERLASDEVREAVVRAVGESIRDSNYLGDPADENDAADAALTAVLAALGQEGAQGPEKGVGL